MKSASDIPGNTPASPVANRRCVADRDKRRPLESYPVSLQMAAIALWGDRVSDRLQ